MAFSIKADIERAVMAAMEQIGDEVKEIFKSNAEACVNGTGNYIGSITSEGEGMSRKVYADPDKMSLNAKMGRWRNPGDFEHGSFGHDYRPGMTAILGDGENGSFFGDGTIGMSRPRFWWTIKGETEAQLPLIGLSALRAQGLNVRLK